MDSGTEPARGGLDEWALSQLTMIASTAGSARDTLALLMRMKRTGDAQAAACGQVFQNLMRALGELSGEMGERMAEEEKKPKLVIAGSNPCVDRLLRHNGRV